MNAQALTSEGIALTAAELGPEWSQVGQHTDTLDGGTRLSYTAYSAPSGRKVVLTTAVTPSPELADGVINYLRYQVDGAGMSVTSVQDNGFGDGRAFRAQAAQGDMVLVVYLFRVRNLMAFVNYAGSSSAAADVQTQALTIARKQEAKLFAAFAPPPAPASVPTAAPTQAPTPVPVATSVPAPTSTPDAPPLPAAPHCQPGETPQFRLGFASLSAVLGPTMGSAISCEYTDPAGSGDTLQSTDTGLAIYRVASGTATFTNGSDHWALVGGQAVHWAGDSLDPPQQAGQDLA